MEKLLKGKPVADKITEDLKDKVKILKKKNVEPTLGIIRVGEREDDLAYERAAINRCKTIGVKAEVFTAEETVTEKNLIKLIESINNDESIHGILLFKPLPKHLDENKISNAVNHSKDIDGITRDSLGGIFTGESIGYSPCTARACVELLNYYKVQMSGKNVVILGRSLVIGKPVSMMLMDLNATVTICHSKTENLEGIMKRADIVIVGIGKEKSQGKENFSSGQIVIDVGIHVNDEGKLCGDVDFEKVKDVVGAITPVPGGVGSVTTAVLVKQLVEAAEKTIEL